MKRLSADSHFTASGPPLEWPSSVSISTYSASLAVPVGAALAYEMRGCGLKPIEYHNSGTANGKTLTLNSVLAQA